MLYRVVVKSRPDRYSVPVYHCPTPYAHSADEVLGHLEWARIEFAQAEEMVVVMGQNYPDWNLSYHNYMDGKPYRRFDPATGTEAAQPTDPSHIEMMRRQLEFAPLRDEYPVGSKGFKFSSYSWSRDEWALLVRLMTRVLHGEIGGPEDGRDDASPAAHAA